MNSNTMLQSPRSSNVQAQRYLDMGALLERKYTSRLNQLEEQSKEDEMERMRLLTMNEELGDEIDGLRKTEGMLKDKEKEVEDIRGVLRRSKESYSMLMKEWKEQKSMYEGLQKQYQQLEMQHQQVQNEYKTLNKESDDMKTHILNYKIKVNQLTLQQDHVKRLDLKFGFCLM